MNSRSTLKRRSRRALLGTVFALLLSSLGSLARASDTQAADEAAVRAADAQWSKAAAAHDLAATVAFYSDDATLLPPNAAIVNGKEGIRTAWIGLLTPEVTVTWQASKVEVSRSGDLAYVVGTYSETLNAQSKTVDHGKVLEVWKKQPDGKWKVVADMYSSDLPNPAPEK